jgi:hypothetical protein
LHVAQLDFANASSDAAVTPWSAGHADDVNASSDRRPEIADAWRAFKQHHLVQMRCQTCA